MIFAEADDGIRAYSEEDEAKGAQKRYLWRIRIWNYLVNDVSTNAEHYTTRWQLSSMALICNIDIA